jgi:cyclophilin family peptidyl-prolyl cis-trans isomerase
MARPRALGVSLGLVMACASTCRGGPPQAEALAPPEPSAVLADFPAGATITARLETDAGTMHCVLDPARAPRAVALFVGLAIGRAAWREPATGTITRRPLYRDRAFFRAIAGVMIQSGDPRDDSTGHPGFRIAVEPHADDGQRLAEPGALVLARYTPPPGRTDPQPPPPGHVLGSQFAVLLTDMSHLTGQTTVLGRCGDLAVAAAIAADVAADRPRRLVRVSVR